MSSNIRIRFKIIVYIVIGLLAALLLRLYFLQVISGEIFAEMASESISRRASIAAPRGNIYDRNGKLIVKSTPVSAVAAEPHILIQDDGAIELLSDYLDIPAASIREKLENANISYLERVFLKTGIDKPTMIRIKESSSLLPGVEIVDIYLREYNYGVLGSHILGYTGEIDEEKLASDLYQGDYSGGDQIGLTGCLFRRRRRRFPGSPGRTGRPVRSRRPTPAAAADGGPEPPDRSLPHFPRSTRRPHEDDRRRRPNRQGQGASGHRRRDEGSPEGKGRAGSQWWPGRRSLRGGDCRSRSWGPRRSFRHPTHR